MNSRKPNDNSIATIMKSKLDSAINGVISDKEKYVKNPGSDFTRDRKLNLETVIRLILCMQGNSLPKELYEYFKASEEHVTASAFVQQRDKIKPALFSSIFRTFNNLCADSATYKGYHLYAIDGSDINIARNPDDKDTYLEQGGKLGFNQLHLNALFDLMNKTYADCIIQSAHDTHEVLAANKMIDRFKFPTRSILIADRGYQSVNLFEHVRRAPNLDFLVRVKNTGTMETRDLPMEELDITQSYELRTTQRKADKIAFDSGTAKWIPKTKRGRNGKLSPGWDFESPCHVTERIVRFEITPGHYETIITSLPKDKFPLSEIKSLYHLRWGIETSFRELKYAIGMINLHSKKVEYIKQEIMAALIMYNFCERVTMSVVICSNPDCKHEYQVNFTMAIHICRDFFSNGTHSPPDVASLISRYILPVRQGRSGARNLRVKSAVYFTYRVAA